MNPCFFSFFSYASVESPPLGNSQLLIRAAIPKDIKPLTQVLTESFHSSEGLMAWMSPLFKLGIYEDLRSRLKQNTPRYICLVATITDEAHNYENIVGTAELSIRGNFSWFGSGSDLNYPYISNLAVRPTHRRQGIARQLLLCCEKTAISWGFDQIALHVLENNYQAQQLYFKHGYQLHRLESGLTNWILNQPRRLFLNKHISHGEN